MCIIDAYVCVSAVSGLRKLVFGNFGYAMGEFYRGIYKAAQVKELQKFVPSLKTSDVIKFVAFMYFEPVPQAVNIFIFHRIPVVVADICWYK